MSYNRGYSRPSIMVPGHYVWYDDHGVSIGTYPTPMPTYPTYGKGGTWGPGPYKKNKPKEKKPKVANKSIESQITDEVQNAIVKAQVASLLSVLGYEQRQEVIDWLDAKQSEGSFDGG